MMLKHDTEQKRSKYLFKLIWCLIIFPGLLVVLSGWQLWRADQQVIPLRMAHQEIVAVISDVQQLPPQEAVRIGEMLYRQPLAQDKLAALLDDIETDQYMNRIATGIALVGGVLAILVTLLGTLSLVAIRIAARVARRSRGYLLVLFSLGRNLLPYVLIAQVSLLAMALLCSGLFEILRFDHPMVATVGIAIILLGLVAAAFQLVASIGKMRGNVETQAMLVEGRALTAEQAPEIWALVRDIAVRLDATAPEHIVVGLTDGFYVTANPVMIQPTGQLLEGHTLYLSLPLLSVLDHDEFAAILAHELAHFAGQDTRYTLQFLPIYHAAVQSFRVIKNQEQEEDSNVFERAALKPALLLVHDFLEQFDHAVKFWSRQREFAADAAAARLVDPMATASALMRTMAAHEHIHRVIEHSLASPVPEPPNLLDAMHQALRHVDLKTLAPPSDGRLPHPRDTHPLLTERCASLGLSVEQVWTDKASKALAGTSLDEALGHWLVDPAALGQQMTSDLFYTLNVCEDRQETEPTQQANDESMPPSPELKAPCVIHETSMFHACLTALGGAVAGGFSIYLGLLMPYSLDMPSVMWIIWLLVAGLLVLAVFLFAAALSIYQRHGQVAMTLTPESIEFADALSPIPMYTFQAIEVEWQCRFKLAFMVTVGCPAPEIRGTSAFSVSRLESLRRTRVVAGGKRVKVDLFGVRVDGRKVGTDELAQLIYAYIIAGHEQRASHGPNSRKPQLVD